MAANLIDTPAKRAKLVEAKKPYWEVIAKGVALGYRKQPGTTRWLVRYIDPNARNPKQPYKIEAFAYPDDAVNEGRETLPYDPKAERNAVTAALEIARVRTKAASAGSVVITVRTIVERYIAMRDRRDADMGRPRVRSDANLRLTKYVLSHAVADVRLCDLTRKNLSDWRNELDGEFTTRRRLVNDFKAALNSDFVTEDYQSNLPTGYSDIVKLGLALKAGTSGAKRASSRPIQILSDDEFRATMQAAHEIDAEDGWGGDLYRLILALAATGMRFSQIVRMTVADAHEDDFSLLVPASLKGGDAAYEQQEPIKRLIAEGDFRILRRQGDNRPADAPLLERNRHVQISPIKWEVDSRGPWSSASELTRPWAKIRQRAGLDASIIPYAFRHTSIVRMLKARLPASHVADLHNTSETMLRKHYARYVSDALRDLERGIVRGVAA